MCRCRTRVKHSAIVFGACLVAADISCAELDCATERPRVYARDRNIELQRDKIDRVCDLWSRSINCDAHEKRRRGSSTGVQRAHMLTTAFTQVGCMKYNVEALKRIIHKLENAPLIVQDSMFQSTKHVMPLGS